MLHCKENQLKREQVPQNKISVTLSKPQQKNEDKNKETTEIEDLKRMIKKITN